MIDGKKTESVKVWMAESLLLELTRLAEANDRKVSEYCWLVLAHHVWGHRAGGGDDAPVPKGDG